jgi:hypothetical protein
VIAMNARRAWTWAAVVLVLALVFAAYLQRDVVFTLANQVWSCI